MDGARWVTDQVLHRRKPADLRVCAVWVKMLEEDARGSIDPALLDDLRVTHFWDGRRVLGRWFAEAKGRLAEVIWDSFFVYGLEARWRAMPLPLLGAGFPVVREKGELRSCLFPLLA